MFLWAFWANLLYLLKTRHKHKTQEQSSHDDRHVEMKRGWSFFVV